MPTHKPDLSRLLISQIATLTSKSYTTVKRALAGLEPVARDGKTLYFAPTDVLKRVYMVKAESQRERLDRTRADAQELQNKVARGQYAPISLIGDLLSDASSQVRSILDSLPKRLRHSNPNLKSNDLEIIRRELSEARRAMAAVRPRFDALGITE